MSKGLRTALTLAGLATAVAVTEGAAAQDTAAAEALFKAGKALADSHRYADACPKLEASYAIDPTLGTLLNLADCHEKVGLIARAWSEWSLGANRARNKGEGQRAALAQRRGEALEPRLPRLQIVVRGAAPDLDVARDETPVTAGMAGVDLPVDPGPHVVTVRRGEATLKRIDVSASERSHDVVTVDLDAIAQANPPPAAGRAAAGPAGAQPPTAAGRVRDTLESLALAFGALGVTAGAGLGVAAIVMKAGEDGSDCAALAAVTYCNAAGQKSIGVARTLATAGQWSGVGGLALLGTGLVLALTARPPEKVAARAAHPWAAPWVAPGGGGVSAGWTF